LKTEVDYITALAIVAYNKEFAHPNSCFDMTRVCDCLQTDGLSRMLVKGCELRASNSRCFYYFPTYMHIGAVHALHG